MTAQSFILTSFCPFAKNRGNTLFLGILQTKKQTMPASVFFVSLIQNGNPQIQIARKAHPQQIGNQQIPRRLGNAGKRRPCGPNQHPQQHQPPEGNQKYLQTEKQQRPYKIDCQLYAVECQRPPNLPTVFLRCQHQIRGYAHQCVQYSPDHREQPRRRRQRRLIKLTELLHTVSGQKGGKPPYRQRDCNTYNEFFPFDFQFHHPCLIYEIWGGNMYEK